MSAADGVSVSVDVDVDPDVAFEVFTQELDAWWARGPRFRFLPPYAGTMTLEPGIGGRLLHVQGEAGGRAFVVGHVDVWEPPHRLALTWRLPNFAPAQVTYVEVRFEPVAEGTRVTVTHRGWDGLPPGHPARHDLVGREFILMKGRWWGDVLTTVKRCAERRRSHSQGGGSPR